MALTGPAPRAVPSRACRSARSYAQAGGPRGRY